MGDFDQHWPQQLSKSRRSTSTEGCVAVSSVICRSFLCTLDVFRIAPAHAALGLFVVLVGSGLCSCLLRGASQSIGHASARTTSSTTTPTMPRSAVFTRWTLHRSDRRRCCSLGSYLPSICCRRVGWIISCLSGVGSALEDIVDEKVKYVRQVDSHESGHACADAPCFSCLLQLFAVASYILFRVTAKTCPCPKSVMDSAVVFGPGRWRFRS